MLFNFVPYHPVYVDIHPFECLKSTRTAAAAALRPDDHSLYDELSALVKIPRSNLVVTLSCRSALDAYLTTFKRQRWGSGCCPHQNEVLISAINIPDISFILRYHGFMPVPVDLDTATLEWDWDEAERLVSPNTSLMFYTHLYGRRGGAQKAIALARKHNLAIIEDSAEGFTGFEHFPFSGKSDTSSSSSPSFPNPLSSDSDLLFFSFGTIKTQTALGGGIARVRDPKVADGMREEMLKWKKQNPLRYLKKLLLYSLLLWFQTPLFGTIMLLAFRLMRSDHRPIFQNIFRSFASRSNEDEKISLYRVRPCSSLVAVLLERLRCFDKKRFDEDMLRLRDLAQRLTCSEGGVREAIIPGLRCRECNFWLFPYVPPRAVNRTALIRAMDRRGVFASTGGTQLAYIDSPATGPYPVPIDSQFLMRNVVYLPIHKDVPNAALKQIERALQEALEECKAESMKTLTLETHPEKYSKKNDSARDDDEVGGEDLSTTSPTPTDHQRC